MTYRTLFTAVFLLLSVAFSTAGLAQTPATDIAHALELQRQGKTAEAADLLKQVVRQTPNDASAWSTLGGALFDLRKFDDARKAFERALTLQPGLGAAHAGLAGVFLEKGQMTDAMNEARIAQQTEPDNALAHFVLGAGYLWQDNPDSASAQAEAVLRQHPDDPPALLLKVRSLLSSCAKRLTDQESSIYRCVNQEFRSAGPALEKFLNSGAASPNMEFWRSQFAGISSYLKLYDRAVAQDTDAEIPFRSVDEDAHIGDVPRPFNQLSAGGLGAIKLLVLLAPDSKVRDIVALEGWNIRLSETAIRSAQDIRFVPAVRNGQPVAEVLIMKYYFRPGG